MRLLPGYHTVSEGRGVVIMMVEVIGQTSTDITVNISTVNGGATGESHDSHMINEVNMLL